VCVCVYLTLKLDEKAVNDTVKHNMSMEKTKDLMLTLSATLAYTHSNTHSHTNTHTYIRIRTQKYKVIPLKTKKTFLRTLQGGGLVRPLS
jgi:hypothetical protein